DKERVRKICEMLIERGINKKIHWWANTRADLDLETMKLMKEAGCRLVVVGYESGSQELLNNCNKGITLENSLQFAENARKAKLLVHGCFIIGLPGETVETINQTIEFAKRLRPDTAQFFPLMLYPGTRAYEWAKQNGYLTTEDFRKWVDEEGHHETILNLPGLSADEIVRWCDVARKRFYLRPGYILYKIRQSLLHPSEAQRTFKSARTFFKNLLM
ncbi:MAG: radical SAM protein, partial [Candidatus Aenigmatarchaeota archaeon]